ncbi:MAG: hypothetical protein HeimC3_01930 [Candidatus Heimdallarchaeota archaeon LC_3]|nr:MAG: hypothetical protein HeimC3_01930 [Candidatus Heimdallarchaeota archaeon LC_3]
MKEYRSIKDIKAILDITIDSCLDRVTFNMSDEEKKIINRLKDWQINFSVSNQMMQILEAPLSDIEFKDILRQLFNPIIDEVFEQAKKNGIISPQEQKLLDTIVNNFNL